MFIQTNKMKELVQKSDRLINIVSLQLQRNVPKNINWNWRLNSIVGARGTGKTTLLLQRAKMLREQKKEVLYLSLDDLYFTENKLVDLAKLYEQQGGKYLFIDEVHKYPNWARELKNIYDYYPELIVTFSGSSILEIFKQDVDLSRRALMYELPGLSFREFLGFSGLGDFQVFPLTDILSHHRAIASDIVQQVKPLQYFKTYLQSGYYPFFMEKERDYALTIEQIVQLVVETDLRFMKGYDPTYSRKLLQLLRVIAGSPPFKPNISKLSERIGLNRATLINYLRYLEKARLVSLLNQAEKSISVLQKPDKIFLNNPNLYCTLNPIGFSIGSMRETFFQNQLGVLHEVALHPKTDFYVYHNQVQYAFEIGGKNKKKSQIQELDNAYLALDDLETGYAHQIPLWLFGFLY